VFEREVGKFGGPVSNQIFPRHQLGVVVVAGLDALKTKQEKNVVNSGKNLMMFNFLKQFVIQLPVVAVDNQLDGFGRRDVAFLLEAVSQLEQRLDELARLRSKLVPEKVGDFEIDKSAVLDEPAKVGRRDGLLSVKGRRVESSGWLLGQKGLHSFLV